ncbi:MAG TPA: hypothetical protein DCX07_08075 [Phycisphaerales bacterium]|nr:hypothetical protein [Phycisphaerales bacterium]
MNKSSYQKQLRVSLPLKVVLILTFVVLCVTISGGWFYFTSAQGWVQRQSQQNSDRICQMLGLAAQYDLLARKNIALKRLVGNFLNDETVCYLALLDERGFVVASASRAAYASRWKWLEALPVTVSSTTDTHDDLLVLARPIVLRDADPKNNRLVGAMRLVLDTTANRRNLASVQQRMTIIAAAIVLAAIPLGYLLVWRIIVHPMRKLLNVTRRLGEGDFSVRTEMRGNDEIRELGMAFDAMADEVARARTELLGVNERLENTVAARTGELQSTNRRLRDEMAEKEDFLRAVSHDLNAPLRNIAGIATMIMMKWRDQLPEEVTSRLQRIQANVDVNVSLISELLELSRIKTRPQKRRVVDMGELIAESGKTFEFELKQRGIEFRLQGPMPKLYVEPARLRQVFQNLVDNAIKYLDKTTGGRIEVGYRQADGMHQFCVADNGPGIAPEQHQKIFYVFRRVEGQAAAQVPGKGVGLALVKSVVANYDGRAWVESDVGNGARFYVALDARCTRPPENATTETMEAACVSDAENGSAGG